MYSFFLVGKDFDIEAYNLQQQRVLNKGRDVKILLEMPDSLYTETRQMISMRQVYLDDGLNT